MTPARRARSQAASAIASAVITGLVIVFIGMTWSSPSEAQGFPCPPSCETSSTATTIDTTTTLATTTTTPPSEWDGSRWTGPNANGETVSDGSFSGTFVHTPPAPFDTVDLSVLYTAGDVHPAACGPAPGPQPQQTVTTTTTPPESQSSTMNFSFEVAFTCNGTYDATATARLKGPPQQQDDPLSTYELTLTALHVAVPPQQPLSFLATDNGNQTVTLTWQPPSNAPPDLIGYRLSRRDPAAQTFTVLGDTPPDTLAFNDGNIPTTGGSYFYQVETLRTSPNGTLLSNPMVTSEALAVAGGSGGGGRTVGGVPAQSPGDGVQHFDETTLAADEGEPGEGDLAVPGGGTIQRFAGRDGAGLLKPFAAALDLAVWAGLLLFLTRRAASAARADALAVELEHPS